MFFSKKRNTRFTPKATILEQMNEPRPLPMGRQEFDVWSDRIISGAIIPGVTPDSVKFALAEMIMHIKPTDDHVADSFFIKSLRKSAANQVAYAVMEELRAKKQERLKQDEDEKKLKLVNPGDVVPPPARTNGAQILADKKV